LIKRFRHYLFDIISLSFLLDYYDDINYIGLGSNRAFIEVGGEYWRFNKNGTTDLPGD
jgi:hypothetical protein